MKQVLRNFMLTMRQFATTSWLNILGLSAAFAIFIVVAIQVNYDFAYDRSYKNADDIVLLEQHTLSNDSRDTWMNMWWPHEMWEKIPELENYTVLRNYGDFLYTETGAYGNINRRYITTIYATQGCLDIFTPEIIAGDTTGIFSANGKGLISEKTALKFFGTATPIGRTLKCNGINYTGPLTIAAVYKDFPDNSTLDNGLWTKLPEMPESEWGFTAYFKVKPENVAAAEEKLNSEDILGEGYINRFKEDPDSKFLFELPLLKERYLYGYRENGSRGITSVISFLIIGFLVLLIAFVNSLNFQVAMAPSRIHAAGLRKAIGATASRLRVVLGMDGVIMALIAVALSVIYLQIFSDSQWSSLLSANVAPLNNIPIIIAVAIAILGLMFVVGLATAGYATSVDTALAVKGSYSTSPRGVKLRNTLITVQFIIAIVMICISGAMYMQREYMRQYDWGLDKENVLYVDIGKIHGDKGADRTAFADELARDPDIIDHTFAGYLPGEIAMSWGRTFEGKRIHITAWSVAPDFLRFFKVPIVAGEDFRDDMETEGAILNETFLKSYGFNDSIVGHDFNTFSEGKVIGIAKDVNFESLHNPIRPMAFVVLQDRVWRNNQLLLRIRGDVAPTMDFIRKTWAKFSREDITMGFLDERLDTLYKTDKNMTIMMSVFGLMIVVIAVMGVYGLILFNTRYKRKEIALRKVNGATRGEIVLMLNRRTLWLLAIAFVIALPVAVLAIRSWLSSYAYKVSVPWWLYAGAGLLVLIISVVTVAWQSWRAASANPADAMKMD
jgi:putative ABC transport system permease protein